MTFKETRLQELFSPMRQKFVAIIGDVMLDRYIWGSVSRISPEAPVPVVDVLRESIHPGGASNVALNVKSLGATPVLFGAVGDDSDADDLRALFRDQNIATDFLVTETHRPTTVKTRIIAGSQHVVRIDYEHRNAILPETANRIADKLSNHINSIDVIVIQDYNKGVVSEELIQSASAIAREKNIPVLVDPKFMNFFSYRNVTVFKPNRKETEDALGWKLSDEASFEQAAREMMERLQCENVLLTLGELGMLLLQNDGSAHRIPTRARKVADVSGAGDTVVATLACAIAAGANVEEASHIANLAGGLVCEEVGIVPVDRDALYDAALSDRVRT